MSENYKPGDVFDVFVTTRGRRHRAVRVDNPRYPWQLLDGYGPDRLDPISDQAVTDVRPLVLLNIPQRVVPAFIEYLRGTGNQKIKGDRLDNIADQIEAQTRPPKPAEPGKYGVVIDSDGHEWSRYTTRETTQHDWIRATDDGCEYRRYADIDVVQVIREGVDR